MINLSNKAAKRFNIKWSDLPERSGDHWKVDVVMMGRVPMLLIVHEHTLSTLVRRKSMFRSPLDIADEICRCCPWFPREVPRSLGKNGDRRIVGSMNEMKRMIIGFYTPDDMAMAERSLNTGLYTYLSAEKYGYGRPFQAVENYRDGQVPWL